MKRITEIPIGRLPAEFYLLQKRIKEMPSNITDISFIEEMVEKSDFIYEKELFYKPVIINGYWDIKIFI